MASTSVISVRVSNDLLERISATGVQRNAFIISAVEEKLNPVKMPDLTDAEKKNVVKAGKTLNEMMRDAMMQRFLQERDLLRDMPKDEFAQMVIRLLPKENLDGTDMEADVLSLQKCIALLPGMDDATAELNRVKLEYRKLASKYKTAKHLLNHVQHKESVMELMENIYRSLLEYIVEMVIRNSLPGLGDGGGLSETGYREVADRVKKDFEKLKLSGRVVEV
jgi:hypothetical protein